MVLRSPGGHHLSIAVSVLSLMVGTGLVGWLSSSPAQPPRSRKSDSAKSVRIPWTTSRVVGSPEPPPRFKVVRAFPNLKFKHPLLIARCPGSDRLFVGEQAGVLYSFPNRPDAKADLFFDLRKEIKTIHLLAGCQGRRGGLRAGLPPRLREEPSVLRLLHPARQEARPAEPEGRDTGVSVHRHQGRPAADRSVERGNRPHLSAGRAQRRRPPLRSRPHALHLHRRRGQSEPARSLQHRTGHLRPSFLHPADRRGSQGRGQELRRPKGQPIRRHERSTAGGLGLRLPQPLADEPSIARPASCSSAMSAGSFGRSVHRVEKGGNYGWSAMEGPQPIKPEKVGPTPIRPALIELPHTIACSVTGGRVYHGKKFPELRGAYIFGDWETRRLWAARFEGDRTKEMPEIARPSVRIVAFGEDKDGEMYFLDYDGGTLHTIERNDARRQERRFPDETVRDGFVRLGQGPQAGRRRGPVRGEQPAMAGRRDGGTLGRLSGPFVRHPLCGRQADPRQRGLASISACTSPRTRC